MNAVILTDREASILRNALDKLTGFAASKEASPSRAEYYEIMVKLSAGRKDKNG